MLILDDDIADHIEQASELFALSQTSDDNQVGIRVKDTNYVAAFEIKPLGEDVYSFKDFLIEEPGSTVIAIDEDTSGDDYSEEDITLLITNRLSNIDTDFDGD